MLTQEGVDLCLDDRWEVRAHVNLRDVVFDRWRSLAFISFPPGPESLLLNTAYQWLALRLSMAVYAHAKNGYLIRERQAKRRRNVGGGR